MQRITITIEAELAQDLDRLVEERGYQNRSEAVRDLVRAGIALQHRTTAPASRCVATLSYVYRSNMRDLPKKLGQAYQDHHDLAVATTRVALDHESCLEVAVLRGKTKQVEHFAEHVIAERGVLHGHLTVIPVQMSDEPHTHGDGPMHRHEHIK